MPQQRVYHDYVNEKLVPYWYVLTFKPCEIDWDKSVFYFDVIKPFEFIERDEFDESILTFSLKMSDFLVNRDYPNKLGINIKTIKNRILNNGIDPYVVQQFILPYPDVEEILYLVPNKRTMELVI
ncbi:hypothetical protein [Heyndrickxia sporothermodurans]|uniref:Uncharacterized protein n=1 Tax=Heyndrickxia sporothermodurans TaxID=46224 RepID=A0AB37HE31_9BACI|nr:hypothetical protein [Heyndrickxia sporothermodurans]MBL5769042.1 hypothetical protein [Heyndrickxia sporothermodurans]MBL5772817.1 hypothetical protein [Heyndrickxia sporothermodurans]MBL5786915.1 hypothetical protein [Heyndrickxia sporothermodurans]MBL5790522.1 hypothetical protein [Heyndrickxia sporothermodurans]MBL5805033.1 hypothetical protein [Heyndrickxia sporothermodurans]